MSAEREAQNKYLSNLGKIPELIELLSSIQADVKTQPEVSEKVSKVLGQLEGVKQALDSMNKKIATSSENIKQPNDVSEKPSIWSIFGSKK